MQKRLFESRILEWDPVVIGELRTGLFRFVSSIDGGPLSGSTGSLYNRLTAKRVVNWIVAEMAKRNETKGSADSALKFVTTSWTKSRVTFQKLIDQCQGQEAYVQNLRDLIALTDGARIAKPRPELSSIARDTRMDQVLERGKLRVGWIPYPPFVRLNSASRAGGIYPTWLTAVCASSKLTIEPVLLQRASVSLEILKDEVDVVACLLTTDANLSMATFVGSIASVGLGGLVVDPPRMRVATDLAQDKVRIGVVDRDTGWEYAVSTLKLAGDVKRLLKLSTPDLTDLGCLVASGRIDVALTDALTCRLCIDEYLDKDEPERRLLRDAFTNRFLVQNIGLAVPKGENRFAAWLQGELTKTRGLPEVVRQERALFREYAGIVNPI